MAKTCTIEEPKDMLPRFLARHKLLTDYRKALLFQRWHEIVGVDMAKQVIPQSLKFKTLYVYIKNPVWANNFQYVKTEVINKINQVVGKKMVEEICFSRFKQKESYIPPYDNKQRENNYKDKLNAIKLSEAEEANIKAKVSKIADEDMAAKLLKIMRTQAKRDKLRKAEKWEPCIVCGKLLPPDEQEICFNCLNAEREERFSEMRAIFQIMPSIKYSMLEEYVDCTLEEYNLVKDELIQLWCSRLRPGIDYPDSRVKNGTDTYSLEAKMVTVLYRGITPEELTKQLLAKTIRRLKNNTAYWDLPTITK